MPSRRATGHRLLPSDHRVSGGAPDDVNESRGASGGHRADRAGRDPATLERSFPARPESVGAIRGALTTFVTAAGVPRSTVDAVTLAAYEAATNVVLHAYAETGRKGTIDVTAALAADELWVIVTDSGSGLQPHRDSPGLGLGLAIIARVADGVDLVKPASGGLEVRMRFAVGDRR
jgi:anti-sigma regulatory factor (Ser/Thr protein kinase)